MIKSYIENYIGEWENEAGNRFAIKKVDDETALVSFFSPPDNLPIYRPWCGEKPSIDMLAKYRPEEGPGLVVELWEDGKGFQLDLNFEPGYILDELQRDSIVPGLSRYEKDVFLDEYYHFFEPLKHYIKKDSEQSTLH